MTFLAVTSAAALLMGVGVEWASRQNQRFTDEERGLYAAYPEALAAIEAGESYTLRTVSSVYESGESGDTAEGDEPTLNWGGETLVMEPSLRVYTSDGELLPWYIEQDTGRVFSDEGSLMVGFVYDAQQQALANSFDGSPLNGYVVQDVNDPQPQISFEYHIPSRRAMYHSFFAIPAALCGLLALCLGLVLALPRRLAVGRGFWGKLPFELYAGAVVLLGVGVFEAAGYLTYAALDDSIPDVLRTLFFVNQTDSETLALALLFLLFWLCAFVLFQAGASLGMGLRDGFGRYLLCRCWTVRFCAWVWRGCAATVRRLLAVDWKQPIERTLAKLLGVNFLIMVLCCCVWAFGIAGCVIYTFIMFFVLRGYFMRVQQQYDTVRDATARMAAGDLKTPVPALPETSVLAPVAESLDQVRQGFGKAVAQEVRSQNMKTELITNVSHDLKTPLTAIITYVDLLKNEDLPAAQRQEYVATLDKKSQRLKRLIDDLFEVSKAASGNVEFRQEPVELGSLLRQIQFELEDQLQASGVEFRWNLPEYRLPLTLDGQRTCRVFENLLLNIAKYGMPGTRAYIDLSSADGRAVVTMKNVSATELDFGAEDITERFVRGDKSRNTEGSGLGLAIAKSFTELQGGAFALSTDGDLFKATVSFPLEAQAAEAAPQA